MASKRKPVSIDTKVQALDEVAKEYGVPCNTLLTWLKNKLGYPEKSSQTLRTSPETHENKHNVMYTNYRLCIGN